MERLVRRAQRGDKAAFMDLIEENQLALYRAAKAILHREEDVEDAVQEAICKAFYKLSDLRQPKYFKTWLTRILINCCYDLLRQQKGLVPLEVVPEEGMLSLFISGYLGRNSDTQAACFSIFSLDATSFPARIYSSRISISSFSLAGRTASPITSISPMFSFLM